MLLFWLEFEKELHAIQEFLLGHLLTRLLKPFFLEI